MSGGSGVYETVDISGKDNFANNFMYNSAAGRILLSLLVRPLVTGFAGLAMDSSLSRVLIRGFIKQNNIKMEDYCRAKYKSFNDFFTRQIKRELRPFSESPHDLAAPCDGKLTAYPITETSVFHIKNSAYTLESLLKDKELAAEFTGGVCLIFRLCPDDYHRYVYIDDGETLRRKKIKGVFHTVRPVALQKYRVFCRNAREYAVTQTKNFGKVIQMEVGALFVGRIKNHETERAFKRGDEKGMFEFGGSTVIMLFQKDAIKLDSAIYENTRMDKETIVRMGCKIGEKTIREEEKT